LAQSTNRTEAQLESLGSQVSFLGAAILGLIETEDAAKVEGKNKTPPTLSHTLQAIFLFMKGP